MPENVMKMPALAVVGPDHRIVRSTEAFRRRYEDAEKMCQRSRELDQVLTGHADMAKLSIGEMSVEIEAVMDAAGRRQAMITLPPSEPASAVDPPLNALRDAAEESPAIVWVKDLDGRYLFANPRYVDDLETSEDRLLGNTDADLPETETVDGPRLRYAEDGLKEPLQLEYTVPSMEHRPALVAFRFALRDETGQPVATCGVAARADEAHVARDEAVRLMQLERWNRLDPVEVRAELLEQWHVQAAPPRPAEPEPDEEAPPAMAEVVDKEEAAPAPITEAPPTSAEPAPELVASAFEVEEPSATPEPALPAAPQPAPESPAPEPAATPEPAAAPEPALPPAAAWSRFSTAHEPVEAISRPPETTPAPMPVPPPTSAPAPAAPSLSETAELLQTDLHLARKWAERAEELQGELQRSQARIRQAESDAQQALAAAARAAEEGVRWRTELEEARLELERVQADAHTARAETEAVRGELGVARAQAEALRGPSIAALRLSEELGRAMAAERQRGDELERTLARLRSRLSDFESALDPAPVAAPHAF